MANILSAFVTGQLSGEGRFTEHFLWLAQMTYRVATCHWLIVTLKMLRKCKKLLTTIYPTLEWLVHFTYKNADDWQCRYALPNPYSSSYTITICIVIYQMTILVTEIWQHGLPDCYWCLYNQCVLIYTELWLISYLSSALGKLHEYLPFKVLNISYSIPTANMSLEE